MKHRISVSIEESTLLSLRAAMRSNKTLFRNKSHFVEYVINKFCREENGQI